MNNNTWVVIMAGGAGTRFWPVSRRNRPKQLLALVTEKSLLLETIHRVAPSRVPYERVIIVAGTHLEAGIAREIGDLGCRLLLEPMPRNTAPCIGFAATVIAFENPSAVMAVLPADQYIEDDEGFGRVFDLAVEQATRGLVATLGVTPDHPETGYGYIRRGEEVATGVFRVQEFVEKPNLETAKGYLDDGNYDWNAGMFFMRADVALAAISKHLPRLSAGMATVSEALGTNDIDSAIENAFRNAEPISIDYGVMEKEAANIVDIPCNVGWTDLGSWRSLLPFREQGSDNFVRGDCTLRDVTNSVIVSDGPHVAVVGMSDVSVVATGDAVLVAPLDRAQDIGAVARGLKTDGREELL